jgi:hypothetical protein
MALNLRGAPRVLVGALALAGLLASLTGFGAHIVRWMADPGSLPRLLLFLPEVGRQLAAPAFPVLGLLIVWLSPRQSGAFFGVLFLSVYALWGAAGENLDRGADWFLPLIMVLDFLFHTSAIRFAQSFPRPLERSDVLALGESWMTRILASFFAPLLNPRVFWPVAVVCEAAALTLPVPGLYTAHVLFVSFMATMYFYAGYRRGTEAERQRIFWLMEAAVIFVATELVSYAVAVFQLLDIFPVNSALVAPWLHLAMVWSTLTCIALAIFYKGAFDSRLVLRRTTVASAAGAAAVVIFITLETAVSEALEGFFGFQSQIGSVAGGVAVALLLRPIVDRIDRRLGGKGNRHTS